MTPWCQFIMASCTACDKKSLMEGLILDNYWVLHHTLFFDKNTLYKDIKAQIGYKKEQIENKVKLGLCSVGNKNIYNKSREMLFKNNVQ